MIGDFMFCPIRSLCPEVSNECAEKSCAFWHKNECVIAGFLKSFIREDLQPVERDEPGM